MARICRLHLKHYAASRIAGDIVFSKDFISLCNELALLYERYNIENPEKEAFQDAYYSFLTQHETGLQALSL